MKYRKSKLYRVVGDELVDEGETMTTLIPENDEDVKTLDRMRREGKLNPTPHSFHDPIYTGEDTAEPEDFPDEEQI